MHFCTALSEHTWQCTKLEVDAVHVPKLPLEQVWVGAWDVGVVPGLVKERQHRQEKTEPGAHQCVVTHSYSCKATALLDTHQGLGKPCNRPLSQGPLRQHRGKCTRVINSKSMGGTHTTGFAGTECSKGTLAPT